MARDDLKGSEQVEKLEEALQPCINVIYGKSYRVVLERAIEVYRSSGGREGVSFYSLYYKDSVLNSKEAIERALRTLSECGYLICRERVKGGKKRKDYYPTPLGIIMNKIVKLRDRIFSISNSLSQQAQDDLLLILAVAPGVSYIMKLIIQEVYSTIGNAYTLTTWLYQHRATPLPPHIVTAYKTIYYTIEQARIMIIELLADSSQGGHLLSINDFKDAFIEATKKRLEETLKGLKEDEHTYEQILLLLSPLSNEDIKFIGNTVLSAIRDLEELYEGLLKYLEFTKE